MIPAHQMALTAISQRGPLIRRSDRCSQRLENRAVPTVVPVPDIDWSRYPDMNFLKNIDAAGNACPSLHVATALFSSLWLHRSLRRINGPCWLMAVNALWCAGIIYSTMAIRQHVAVDVAAGILLGAIAALLSLRQAGPIKPLADTPG